MTETIELRPIKGTPEEVAKARQKFQKGAGVFVPAIVVLLLGLPIECIFFLTRHKLQDVVGPIILLCMAVPMIRATKRLRNLGRNLKRFEKIYCFSSAGLTTRISYNGEPAETPFTIPWKDIVEVRDESDAVVLKFSLGKEGRFPNDNFRDSEERQSVIAQVRNGISA